MKYQVEVKLNKDFIREEGGRLIIGIKSKPVQGKANQEVIRKIAGYFKVLPSSIKIITGKTSRKKLIEVKM